MAVTAAPIIGRVAPIPAMALALVIGIALNPLARQPLFHQGITFCMKVLLRWAVALLGLRIALGEIAALGLATAALVVVSMALTLASGFLFARAFGQKSRLWGARGRGHRGLRRLGDILRRDRAAGLQGEGGGRRLRGGGGQRALHHRDGALSAGLCSSLGLDPQLTGVMLGATIHDVAQVVGAGYAVSKTVGNTARRQAVPLLPAVPGRLVYRFFMFARRSVASDAAHPVPDLCAGVRRRCACSTASRSRSARRAGRSH